jgi:hypothetical protein
VSAGCNIDVLVCLISLMSLPFALKCYVVKVLLMSIVFVLSACGCMVVTGVHVFICNVLLVTTRLI